MKRGVFFLVLALGSFILPTMAQEAPASALRLRFYEELAERDAQYEQNMEFLSIQDEQDFWNDQEDFERLLGKSNFTFYLVYMKGKKEAYQDYLQNCDGTCEHTAIYWGKVREYLSVPDSTDVFEMYSGKLAQSSRIRKR